MSHFLTKVPNVGAGSEEYYGHLTFYFWRHLLAPMGIWHYSPDNDYEMFFFTINHLIDSLLKKNHFLCLKNANINY
ncbi:hypothetical protein DERF_010502 [Dermatophagoides farinae]|uniref:Uncharacterized protein n=1 Tax=Dermatophagoides farinae TaxID=6954 RepID=A0A922L531_DERFA|nr:hypothetical protein DERF_010502 [Dermatophagoides farinae]